MTARLIEYHPSYLLVLASLDPERWATAHGLKVLASCQRAAEQCGAFAVQSLNFIPVVGGVCRTRDPKAGQAWLVWHPHKDTVRGGITRALLDRIRHYMGIFGWEVLESHVPEIDNTPKVRAWLCSMGFSEPAKESGPFLFRR